MRRRRFSARCSNRAVRGFTLSEVLVALSMASLIIIGVGSGFVFVSRAWTEHQARTQVQQSNRMTVEAISRELRIAGACMKVSTQPPLTSDFQPISGTHNGVTDTITITGNPRCAGPATVTADCNTCTDIQVDNTTNFVPGMWAYIYTGDPGAGGPYGEYFLVQSVTPGSPGTISAASPLSKNYPQLISTGQQQGQNASSVYGADQRVFAIDSACAACNGVPTLTVTARDGVEQPLVKGIDRMVIQYTLNRTYASNPSVCDGQTGGTMSLCVVNLPETGNSQPGDWELVRAISFAVDAMSTIPVRGTGSPDGYLHRDQTFEISPRNFIFSTSGPRLNWTPY